MPEEEESMIKTFKVAINVDNLKSEHPIKDIADTLRCIADDLGSEDFAGNIVVKENEASAGKAVGRYGFYSKGQEVKIQMNEPAECGSCPYKQRGMF